MPLPSGARISDKGSPILKLLLSPRSRRHLCWGHCREVCHLPSAVHHCRQVRASTRRSGPAPAHR
ncbi:hypothetical protein P7K49_039785, partial [Saguinus oedipus]